MIEPSASACESPQLPKESGCESFMHRLSANGRKNQDGSNSDDRQEKAKSLEPEFRFAK